LASCCRAKPRVAITASTPATTIETIAINQRDRIFIARISYSARVFASP
jgi:hypothetical protein